MSNTLPIEAAYVIERETRPDFSNLIREALAFHGGVPYEHLVRLLPLWRPAIWFPKRWHSRVRRVLRTDPRIEEVDGYWQLRAPLTRNEL
jgi:hypothetical protein